jgi:DNA mismatch repair protein MutS
MPISTNCATSKPLVKIFCLKCRSAKLSEPGITSLKISFNNVFGYYIEVRNTHKDKVPGEWIRKQTLVSAERYITEELKEYESKIMGAEEKILHLETRLFDELVNSLDRIHPSHTAQCQHPCRKSIACCRLQRYRSAYEYNRPDVNESNTIEIKEGRHPVIERQMPIGESYITNSVYLDSDEQQVIIITGPNMSGKSAYVRQTALIVLLAQIGMFRSGKVGQNRVCR